MWTNRGISCHSAGRRMTRQGYRKALLSERCDLSDEVRVPTSTIRRQPISEKSDMPAAKTMSRSRNQIASAYAPESFFTFEGGLGACLAKPLPTRSVEVSSATQNQIFERIEELARSWYDQAKHCRDGVAGAFEVLPRQCVDIGFLNGERSDFQSLNVGDVVLLHPSEMGYVPAPLTFVCETGKLVRTYDSVAKLDKDLAVLGDNSMCPHSQSAKKKCGWRQLDVMLVYWSGKR